MLKTKEYWYWLYNIEGIGSTRIKKMLEIFQKPQHIFVASQRELKKADCLSENNIQAIIDSRNIKKIQEGYHKLKEQGVIFVIQEEELYPERLRHLYSPPLALYVKGKIPDEDTLAIAIVGARNCTAYGKEMAEYFGKTLSKAGVQVISGMARGIDSYAHRGAIEGGTETFAVLGTGVDICYPIENYNLYWEIEQKGGLISEFPLGTKGKPIHFPLRNRIISGLCDGILVVEAREKSGSLITADMGLEQGKEIFTIPGRIGDVLSKGCNNLIKAGAQVVTEPDEILKNFHIKYSKIGKCMKKNNKLLDSKEKIVYACLSFMPKHLNEILKENSMLMTQVMEILFKLEMKGFIKQPEKNYYIKCK